MSACSKIRYIVRIRQMLRRWRKKAAASSTYTALRIPSDVPAGHVAVTVGSSCKRFVVRATYLNHPLFKKLLVRAEEEYGFTNTGPLAIPCDESLFEEILFYLACTDSGKNDSARFTSLEDFQTLCHVGIRSNLEFLAESRPLLHGVSNW
ncbi:SAUR-like auxin-responsive protein family [Abeliophyllum distichum]|uniref:SAUR-like auxin-responsive protein family n=1 Tax=Abeliophyllum distichum TaxID=126358 RepID=A0ABD1SF84_9LAMI